MSLQRLVALVRKEIVQLLRDRRGLAFMLGLPLMQLFLYAYAVNTTVYHIPLAVVDQSDDRKSRELVQAWVNSQYFDVRLRLQSEADVIAAIDREQVKAGVVIPPRFAADTDRGTADVLMVLDGTDSASVSSAFGAASLVAQTTPCGSPPSRVQRRGLGLRRHGGGELPIAASLRVLYNPDMIDIASSCRGSWVSSCKRWPCSKPRWSWSASASWAPSSRS